jgi:hypothetical protein
MKHPVFAVTIAFFLGLGIGSIAIGNKARSPDDPQVGSVGGDTSLPMLATLKTNPNGAGPLDPVQGPELPSADALENEAVKIELGSMTEREQIQLMFSRLGGVVSTVSRMTQRIDDLENKLTDLKSQRASEQQVKERVEEALPVGTPEAKRFALVASGVPETVAEEIVWRQSELELDRLELRDRAIREGWYRTDRYAEELKTVNENAIDLRSEVGEAAYDQYLYKTGEVNRIKVTSIIQGSAAEQVGLEPGDIIETYADQTIFSYSDLRGASTEGSRDDVVPITIRRGNEMIQTQIPRGPLGIRLEADSVAPQG